MMEVSVHPMENGRTFSGGGRVVVWSHDPTLLSSADGPELPVELVRVDSPYEAAAEVLSAPAVALVVDLRLLTPRHLRLLAVARRMEVEMLAVGALQMGMTADDLSGVRLTSRSELRESVETLIRPTEPAPPVSDEVKAEPPPDAPEPAAAQPKAEPDSPMRVRFVPAETPAPEPADESPEAPAPAKAPEVRLVPAKTPAPEPTNESPAVTAPAEAPEEFAEPPKPVDHPSPGDPPAPAQAVEADSAQIPVPLPKEKAPRLAPAGHGAGPDALLSPEEIAALLGNEP